MMVTVANEDRTVSIGICSNLQWSMQWHQFKENLRTSPLGGCDIFLGAEWLRTLGKVTFNFSNLCVSFKLNNQKITLQSIIPQPSLIQMSIAALTKKISITSHGLVGTLFSISSSPIPTTIDILLPLLNEFQDIFHEHCPKKEI